MLFELRQYRIPCLQLELDDILTILPAAKASQKINNNLFNFYHESTHAKK